MPRASFPCPLRPAPCPLLEFAPDNVMTLAAVGEAGDLAALVAQEDPARARLARREEDVEHLGLLRHRRTSGALRAQSVVAAGQRRQDLVRQLVGSVVATERLARQGDGGWIDE